MIRATTSTSRKANAGCLIPFGLIFLAVGLGIGWFAWAKVLSRVIEVRKWTPTPCQVTQWEIGVTPGADVYSTALRLSYTWTFNGRSYTGSVYDAAIGTTPSINELEEEGATARRGPAVCQVNPANPGEASYIRPPYTLGGAALGFGLLFALIGLAMTAGGIIAILRRLLGGSSAGTAERSGCMGATVKPLFFGTFAIAGFLVWKLAIHDRPDWDTISARMVEVPGKILASGVSKHTSSGKNSKTTYKARAAWEFQFEGRTWRSGWISFDRGTTSSSDHDKAARTAARYPAGASVRGWVDPQAPWQAVLEKSGGSVWWLWLFPLIFGGIGLAGLAWWLIRLVITALTLASAGRGAS